MKLTRRSEEVGKEIPHRFVFVCIGGVGACAQKQNSPWHPRFVLTAAFTAAARGRGRARPK